MAPAVREPMLGYHPCSTGFLTCARDPGGGDVYKRQSLPEVEH